MPEISHVRILSLSCTLALFACGPDAGKTDASKATPSKAEAPKTEAPKTEAKQPESKAPEAKAPEAKAPETKSEPASKFKKGQLARPGLSPEELLEYNKAQGDPMLEITLEQALAGDPALEDKSKGKLFATFDTTMGKIRCELFEDKAPKTVANFVGLARGVRPYYVKKEDAWKTGNFYDGTLFHRVIANFMIQGGDPTGTGTGGPGYLIVDEFDKTLRHNGPGILSMANRGPNTGSSQFFITVAPTPHLDDKHAIFGKCDPKVAVAISKVKTRADRPLDDVKINTITFERAKK
ncbi:MAG TPA: peptidylprolyl isomerase [Nannocystis sp.]